MRGNITRNRDQDMATRLALSPIAVLAHARLEHLVGVEACVLAQDRMRQGRDQRVNRVAEQKVLRDKARRGRYRALAIQRRQERTKQTLGTDREGCQRIIALVGNTGGRHVEKTYEVEAHGSVEYAAQEL